MPLPANPGESGNLAVARTNNPFNPPSNPRARGSDDMGLGKTRQAILQSPRAGKRPHVGSP